MATTHRASIVSILAVGVSLSGCADISFGSQGTTQEHSLAEASDSKPTEAQPFLSSSAPSKEATLPAIRGRIEEPETKLSGMDDKRPVVAKANPEEAELAERLNPHVVSAAHRLQCVPFVREATGIDLRGNANRWWDLAKGHYERSRQPEEGAILVMRGWRTDRHGHVAVVKEILDGRTIVIDHANWLNDGKIYLNAPVRDESPKNDWSQVRVWYTPGEQWGRRIYLAKGFIYPTNGVASNGPGPIFALSR